MKKNFTPIHGRMHTPHTKHAEKEHARTSSKKRQVHSSTGLFVLGFFLYLFISLNVLASQRTAPDLYYSFAAEDKNAVIETLYKTQFLPEYPSIRAMQRNIFGSSIDAAILKESQGREAKIHGLEAILQQNPQAREVLYALSVLYKEDGQFTTSERYLRQAQAIDPSMH